MCMQLIIQSYTQTQYEIITLIDLLTLLFHLHINKILKFINSLLLMCWLMLICIVFMYDLTYIQMVCEIIARVVQNEGVYSKIFGYLLFKLSSWTKARQYEGVTFVTQSDKPLQLIASGFHVKPVTFQSQCTLLVVLNSSCKFK